MINAFIINAFIINAFTINSIDDYICGGYECMDIRECNK